MKTPTLSHTRRSFVLLSATAAAGTALAAPRAFDAAARLDAFHAAMAALDVGRSLEFLDDDVRMQDPTFGISLRGKQAVREMFQDVVGRLSDTAFVMTDRVVLGPRIATQQVYKGRFRRRGAAEWKPFEVRGASFFEFAGDRIVTWTDYYDANTFLKQTGHEPLP